MLRIHFTGEDLARIRIATGPDPMWEMLMSLHRLRRRDSGVLLGPWLRESLPKVPATTRLLTALAPPVGYSPDFLTPVTGGGLADRLEVLRSTPLRQVAKDLREFGIQNPRRRLPAACRRELLAGDSAAVGRLADAVHAYVDTVLGPFWERIWAQVSRDRARRSAVLAEGGWDAVLSTIHPSARWEYPVLRLAFPVEQDLHLRGRGLLLQPSFFCRYAPTTFADPTLPPVLVHPIEHEPQWATPEAGPVDGRSLAALIGPTRAVLLSALADGIATTGELARRAGTTPPNASRHITALREAALVSSHRHRNATLHTITKLGRALLEGRNVRLCA
ncbi:helix-turn-helix transcriptional regulator [Streptomyces sp. TLI_105]|uniref:ArsR/SmtB family transcription factor n=1 Tax=Streptomyces sp. TLI_105 TaxID=1881019 RepID=UPI0008995B76|nr:winged helix-turn-helix domain-containing protein [Streptomyces sp. TLI_105]SEC43545.1 DNA-binding transcriptional regulator, ArsR family [Streptomyces sp. TLI_105]